MIYNYECTNCKTAEYRKIYQDEMIWKEDFPMSEEEAKKLPEWDDPRFHEKVVSYGKKFPEKLKCNSCGKKTANIVYDIPEGFTKGNCFINRERERKFHENGMSKEQATEFYKNSIEASKERIQSAGVHYKQVVPDMKHFEKHGMAKRTSEDKKQIKRKYLHDANVKLTKEGKIDPHKKL